MDRNLLNNATSSDDSSTPGYMLTDIAKATLVSYQACQQLQEYLLSRIKKNNYNIKYKCLVIIKHVCRSGRADFKKEMSRNVEPIKECLQYRGPPDPLRGDEIYKRVRDAAKEAIDAIYDSNMPVTTSAVAAANRIQGMGGGYVDDTQQQQRRGSTQGGFMNSVSNALSSLKGDGDNYTCHPGATESFGNQGANTNNGYGGYNSGNVQSGSTYSNTTTSNTSSSGMVGIGNPNFSDARNESSWMEKASNIAINSASSIASATSVFGKSQKSSLADNGFGFTTNRGNNAFGQGNPNYNPSFQPTTSAWGNSAPSGGIVPEISLSASGVGRAGNAAVDGEYEKSMVDSLCEPGGLKPVPPEDKLQAFLNVTPTLSPEVIGSCIVDSLNSDAWQSRTKALQVISSIVQAPGCEAHDEWWRVNIDEVKGLLNDDKVNVRNQASKTLKLFDIDVGSSSNSNAQNNSKSVKNKQQEISLIDDSDYGQPVASYVAPAPDNIPVPLSASVPIEVVDNIFAGMAVGSSSSSSNSSSNSSSSSSSSSIKVDEEKKPAISAAPISSVFDFLESSTSVLTPSSASTVPSEPIPSHPAPAVPAVSAMTAFDFLSDTIPASLPPLSQNSNMDMFGSLNVNSNSQPLPGVQYPPQLQQVLGKMSMPVQGMYPMNTGMNTGMNPGMMPAGYRPQVPPNFGVIPPNSMNAMGGFIKTSAPTIIPTPGAQSTVPSGFSFIGGDTNKKAGGDSFSFVSDEINKASQKK